ncbi:hypothetical protein CHUAL_009834 [Chamberlinius hualienensis]
MSVIPTVVFLAMFAASFMVTSAKDCQSFSKCPDSAKKECLAVIIRCLEEAQKMEKSSQTEIEEAMTVCMVTVLMKTDFIQDIQGCPGCESNDFNDWTCDAFKDDCKICMAEAVNDLNKELGEE